MNPTLQRWFNTRSPSGVENVFLYESCNSIMLTGLVIGSPAQVAQLVLGQLQVLEEVQRLQALLLQLMQHL